MEDTLQSNTTTSVTNDNPGTIDVNSVSELVNGNPNPEDLDIKWLRWKCLNCGYVYEGVKELRKCPKCGNENPDTLVDVD